MQFILITVIILIFVNNVPLVSSRNARRHKRASCVSQMTLSNCKASGENVRYNYFIYHQILDIELSCEVRTKWKWENADTGKKYDFAKFDNRRVIIFDKDKYPTGKYKLQVSAKEVGGSPNELSVPSIAQFYFTIIGFNIPVTIVSNSTPIKCTIKYICEPPVLIFYPSSVQYINSGTTYTIDLTKSINHDSKALEPTVKMDCKYKNTALCRNSKKCSMGSGGASIKFDALLDLCHKEVEYTVSVEHFGQKIVAKTTIHVTDTLSVITNIECTKNCDKYGNEYSNPKISIGLKLNCVTLCLGFETLKPTWDIVVNSKSLPKSSYNLDKSKFKMVIKEGTLKPGQSAVVHANYPGKYTTEYHLKAAPALESPACDINPKSGESLKTKFTITCKPSGAYMKTYPPMYKILHQKTESKVILAETPFNNIDVVLGVTKGKSQEELSVVCRDIFFNEVEVKLPSVTLTSKKLDQTRLNDMLKQANTLTSFGNGIQAMQMIEGLISEMIKSDLSDNEIDDYAYNIMASMMMLSVESVYLYSQMASSLPGLYKRKNKSDKYNNILSMLCNDLASKNLNDLLKSKYPKLEVKAAKEHAELIRKCTDSVINSAKGEQDDEEGTEDPLPKIYVTVPDKLVSEASVVEDYPNYDDVFVSPEIERQKLNAINAIVSSSEAIAETLDAGESDYIKNNRSETIIDNEEAEDLVGREFEVQGAVVEVGENIAKYRKKNVAVAVTSYFNSPLETAMSNVNTNIIDVTFFDIDKRTTDTIKGVEIKITLDILNNSIEFEEYAYGISDQASIEFQGEHTFNVHRVNLKRSHKCVVIFDHHDSALLELVFTKNRRPDIVDFEGVKYFVDTKNESTTTVECPFKVDLVKDSFIYVGIIKLSDPTDQYKVSFLIIQCVNFNVTQRAWKHAECDTTLFHSVNESKVQCICKHTSLFAAKFKGIDNRLDVVTWTKFTAQVSINYIIILHVFFVFIVYCLALCFVVLRKHLVFGRKSLYFLTDNLKNDRYAYLIQIKTGGLYFAGTTSNIVMQLYGQKCDSKAHLLNYPDPEKRLLQRNNEDWFVLTNSTHLGEIKCIRIWFDSIGVRPSWYCEKVTVTDLQDMKRWDFMVEQWLNFVENLTEIKVQPNNIEPYKKSIIKSAIKYIRFYYDGEHTWNIFSKKWDDHLSLDQRLTIILSQIYTSYTCGVLFLLPPTIETSDAFGYGHLQFYNEMFLYGTISSVLSMLIHLPFIYFFRNSENLETNTLFRTSRQFKYRITYITWAVLASWISICLIYLIIFGFFVTTSSSLLWILTTIISILIIVFVLENIYLSVYNILMYHFYKVVHVTYYNISLLLAEIESQRKIMFRTFGEVLMRPYFKRHYLQHSQYYIKRLADYQRQRSEVSDLFRDMCVFILYIILLYIICLSKADEYIRMSNEHMKIMIVDGDDKDFNLPLEDIRSIEDIYEYLNTTIINAVHGNTWYEGFNLIDGGLMADFNNKILGVVQLRQQRFNQTCDIPQSLYGLRTYCSNEEGIFKDWPYSNGSYNTNALGQKKVYSGEGYIIKLGRTLYNSYFIMHFLKRNNWINVNTEVLFIEFWVYNANHNIFNLIRIIIERDRSGRLWKSYKIFTTRLFYSSVLVEVIITVVLIIFSLIILYIFGKQVMRALYEKRKGIKNIWNIVDLLIIVLSVTIITLYLMKSRIIRMLFENLVEANHNEFINYFIVMSFENTNMYVSGGLLCLATLRLWKFLRFGKIFQVMERTIGKSAHLVLCIAIYHTDIFIMFSMYLYLLHGPYFAEFQSILHSMTTFMLISFSFSKPNYAEMEIQYLPTKIIFVAFMVASLSLLSIYATIIIISLGESKLYYSNREAKYTIANYFNEETQYYRALCKYSYRGIRLKSGGIGEKYENDLVYPKGYIELFANSVALSDKKLKLMKMAAICIIKNNQRFGRGKALLREDEDKYMAQMYLALRTYGDVDDDNDKHVYFIASDPIHETTKLIPFYRLQQMEFIVKLLLTKNTDRTVDESHILPIHVKDDHVRLSRFRDVINVIGRAIANIKIDFK